MSTIVNLNKIFSKYRNNASLYEKAQSAKKQNTMPCPMFNEGGEENFFSAFTLDEKYRKKAHKALKRKETSDIIFDNNVCQNAPSRAHLIMGKYSDEKISSQLLCSLVDWLCDNFLFVQIRDTALYIYEDGYYQLFTSSSAPKILIKIFREYELDYALRSNDYSELVKQLRAQPQIEKSPDECRTNTDIILFSDGAFDVRLMEMRNPRAEDYQFSKIHFPLNWDSEVEATTEARDFIDRFCMNDEVLEKYLWELIGYLLSSYQKKILVAFIGPSNSGKSTLANMIRRICGSESCVALGIKELSASFNLAELHGKRLCIDSEMDASVLIEKDINLMKKVLGNDLLLGNRKFEPQFYFQCQAKYLICSNNKIRFKSDEDMTPFFNRIRVFRLEESIPIREQCDDMDAILDENRTYFLQEAIKGLCRLVQNGFEFSYNEPVENFVQNVSSKGDVSFISNFVENCCEFGGGFSEGGANLYNAYLEYAKSNCKKVVSKKAFSNFLIEQYSVTRSRTSQTRFFEGIRLNTNDR